MKVKQFRYNTDNLGYLLSSGSAAMAVDGGDVDGIMDYVRDNHLDLLYVINTHSHRDHTCGNHDLLLRSGAQLMDPVGMGSITLGGKEIEIIPTPGHTEDSVCFHFDRILLTGDTLFNGKVGRCFTGDTEGFLQSIQRLLEFPDDTLIYAGHDYVLEYIEFDRQIEPENTYLETYLSGYEPSNVVFTLGEERCVDPFLHLQTKSITRILHEHGLPHETTLQRWDSLLTLM